MSQPSQPSVPSAADIVGDVDMEFRFSFMLLRVSATGTWSSWWYKARAVVGVLDTRLPDLERVYLAWMECTASGDSLAAGQHLARFCHGIYELQLAISIFSGVSIDLTVPVAGVTDSTNAPAGA